MVFSAKHPFQGPQQCASADLLDPSLRQHAAVTVKDLGWFVIFSRGNFFGGSLLQQQRSAGVFPILRQRKKKAYPYPKFHISVHLGQIWNIYPVDSLRSVVPSNVPIRPPMPTAFWFLQKCRPFHLILANFMQIRCRSEGAGFRWKIYWFWIVEIHQIFLLIVILMVWFKP